MSSIQLSVRALAPLALVASLLAGAPKQAAGQELPADSVVVVPQEPPATVPTYVPPYSAHSALIRSLVLPGWGQAYVNAPGRGAFYFALEAGSLWMVYKSSRSLAAARQLETELRENGALAATQRLPLAETRSQQVEDWITLSIFWALFAGADAYVSAQLADFAGHVGVAPERGGGMRFQVQLDAGPRR